MKLSTLAALTLLTSLAGLLVGICGSAPSEAGAKSVSYKLPNETATFKPGPNLEARARAARPAPPPQRCPR